MNATRKPMTILEHALDYYRRGWSIIPIRAGTKKPACRSWKPYQTERPDEATVRRWFSDGKPKAMAVIMGEVSGGLICRDFDEMAAYERWAAEHPDLAQTLPTVETGRPGRHVYANADIGQIRAASPSGGSIIEFDDGELRGGGYCLVPPSKHPNGKTYCWLVPLGDAVPTIDLFSCGFLPCNREARENGESRETRETRDTRGSQRDHRTLVGVGGIDPTSQPHPRCPTDSTLHAHIQQAIARTVPTGTRQRHKMLFELARELKAIPALAEAPASELKDHIRQWHEQALPFIVNQTAFEESWFDFAEGWGKVKFPKGEEPIAMIFAKAVEAELPASALQYEQDALRLLVALCRELQRASGTEPFFLSTRTAGRLLDITHVTASRWLRLLRLDGILELVSLGSQQDHKASRYRYVAD